VDVTTHFNELTLYLLTWRIWWSPNNANKGHMEFSSAFQGLNTLLRNKGRLISSMINSFFKASDIKLCLGISIDIKESRAFSKGAELVPSWSTCWRIKPTYFPFSNGGCFQVGGYVNSQSNRHFMLNRKVPSHVDMVSVWCAYN
jgi:hypothetical protein